MGGEAARVRVGQLKGAAHALHGFLDSRFSGFSYLGIDVSESMVRSAQQRFKAAENARFVLSS